MAEAYVDIHSTAKGQNLWKTHFRCYNQEFSFAAVKEGHVFTFEQRNWHVNGLL